MVTPKSISASWRRYREARSLHILSNTSKKDMENAGWIKRFQVKSALRTLRKDIWKNEIRNWYEGGFPLLTGDQSWLNQVVQDARFDQNFVTRRELMRRMRNHAQDVPIHKRGLDISRQYVIGSHMPIVTCLANSEDPDENGNTWCARAEAVWHEETQNIGLNGESLFQMMSVAHDCKKNDGDVLFVKVFKKIPMPRRAANSTQEIFAPALQMIEAHRIETPFNKWEREGVDIIDGVQFKNIQITGPDGSTRTVQQKVGYWVKDTINSLAFTQNYTLIPADQCCFIFSPSRINQIRGISDYYAAKTSIHLLRDLLKLEMRAQERQSDYTYFITNSSGQAFDPEEMRRNGSPGVSVNADGTVNLEREKVARMYERMYGGKVVAGRNGDTVQALAPNRPSEATQALWEFLINSYCAAARVPRVLIFPQLMKGQGTQVRAELDAANSSFVSEFNLCWKPFIHWVYENFMQWRINNDPRVADAPADWKHIEVSHARSVLVDAGYDSAATIAEMQAGITNLHHIAQDMGTTRQRLIDHSVTDVGMLKVACEKIGKKFGVEVSASEVRQSLSDVVKNLAAMKTADAAKENAEKDDQEEISA